MRRCSVGFHRLVQLCGRLWPVVMLLRDRMTSIVTRNCDQSAAVIIPLNSIPIVHRRSQCSPLLWNLICRVSLGYVSISLARLQLHAAFEARSNEQ